MPRPPEQGDREPSVARPIILGFAAAALIVVLAVGGWYAWIAIPYFTGVPTIRRDYVAEANAPVLATPAEDRAWPLYRQAILAMPPDIPELRHGNPIRLVRSEAWAETVAAVAERERSLSLARQGASRPVTGFLLNSEDDRGVVVRLQPPVAAAGFPADASAAFMAIHRPAPYVLPRLGQWLLIDALGAARSGETARALEDLLAGISIASHTSAEESLIGQLIACVIAHGVCNVVEHLISQSPEILTDAQLREISKALATLGNDLADLRFGHERLSFHDLVQRIYTDDGSGDGVPCSAGFARLFGGADLGKEILGADPRSVLAPIKARKLASRRDLLVKYDEYCAAAVEQIGLPLWERTGSVGAMVHDIRARSDLNDRYRVLAVFAPPIDRAAVNMALAGQACDVTRTVIALERFRRERGRYPASLDALVPHHLAEPPIDRFTGDPLGYRLDAATGVPLLYSRGSDRDDDGGVAMIDETGDPDPDGACAWFPTARPDRDGDWILWPLPAGDGTR